MLLNIYHIYLKYTKVTITKYTLFKTTGYNVGILDIKLTL